MSPVTSFSGLASGLDTAAIVDALVNVARLPIARLEEKKGNFSSQLSLVSDLTSKVGTLKTNASAIDTVRDLRVFQATSSDTTKITATASTQAQPGNYVINVNSLCSAERTYSDGVAEKDQTDLVGTGTLTIQVGTDPAVNVDIDQTTDTLEEVARKINDSGAEVAASVMFDGSNYRLVVNSNDTGSGNSIAFTEGGSLVLNLDNPANEAVAATDASITLSGLTVTNDSNQFTEAIPGVTFELLDTTDVGSSVALTIDVNLSAIETKITDMVNSYNDIASFLKSQFTFSGEARGDTLMGDFAARMVKTQIQSVVSRNIPALAEPYNLLSAVGITTNRDGTLDLNSTELHEALADDIDAVIDLFTYSDDDDTTDNDGIAVMMERVTAKLLEDPDGLLDARKDGINSRINAIDSQITNLEYQIGKYEASIQKQFSAMEQTMSSMQSQSNFLSQQSFS